MREKENLTLLGNQQTEYSMDYNPSVLEAFQNKHPENDYFVKFNCPEFTSLCPITGQPDFATITISYVPDERLVESKSLKLYLFSFRNHGDFHEDVINIIMKDLVSLLEPKYIEVWGKFLPRGGLSIDPYCNYGKPGTDWEKVAWNRMRVIMICSRRRLTIGESRYKQETFFSYLFSLVTRKMETYNIKRL